MLFFKEWEVLVVDDEPDVLAFSKLAMKNFKVYGLPLKIHTAQSKEEAITFLSNQASPIPSLAIAFVDIVMETDSAGLELCQTIRLDMQNKLTQLFIRTGQPGLAPERKVIDNYDINGYFTKAEATENKLYSLVKSGIRQYLWSRASLTTILLLDATMTASGSRLKMIQNIQGQLYKFSQTLSKGKAEGCLMVGDTIVATIGLDKETAVAIREDLDKHVGLSLNENGDKYVAENGHLLIKATLQLPKSEAYLIQSTTFTPPADIIHLFHHLLRGLAAGWEQAV